MKTIHKYPFKWDFCKEPIIQILDVPAQSTLIHVGIDPKGETCLWFEKKVGEKRMVKFQFAVVGTGQEFTLNGFEFFDTIVVVNFVLHIYIKY